MKYILITGTYGGMGKVTTEYLSNKGYTIFALDIKTEETKENVIPIKCDLTNEEDINSAFEIVSSITNELFAIIHFAGIYTLDSLVEVDADKYKKAFDINFFGAFLVNKKFISLLKDNSRVILTTSELAPLDPLPFTGIYAITKGALDKYAYSLAMELQLLNIKVSVLRAGAVDTNLLNDSTTALDKFTQSTKLYSYNANRFKKIVNNVEAKKVKPEKIAIKVNKILNKKNPRFNYAINRNPLLILLNILPKHLRFFIIRKILK